MGKQKQKRPNYQHVIVHRNDTLSDIVYSIKVAKGKAVVVYLPDRMKILTHVTNARILRKELDRFSKKVVFLCSDTTTARVLESQGLSVETSDTAEEMESRSVQEQSEDPFANFFAPEAKSQGNSSQMNSYKPPKRKPWYAHFGAIVLGLLAGLGVVVGAIVYYVPEATITISFTGKQLTKDYKVQFQPSAEEVDSQNLNFPASRVEKSGQASKTFESSGEAQENVKTKLQITVTNEQNAERSLVENTRFRSSEDKLYRTVEAVNIPAGSSAQVNVVADQPGFSYNLDSETRLEVVALATDRVYGTVDKVVRSGSKKGNIFVSDKDHQKAKDKLKELLSQKLYKQIREDNNNQKAILSSAQVFKDVTYQRLPDPGDNVETFRPTIKATVAVLTYNERDLIEMLRSRVASQIPEGQRLSDKVSLSFSEPLGQPNLADGVTVRVFIKYTTHEKLDRETIKQDLTMKSFSQVRSYMQQFSGAKVNVELKPKIWLRMPVFKRNITIKTEGA